MKGETGKIGADPEEKGKILVSLPKQVKGHQGGIHETKLWCKMDNKKITEKSK